VKLNDAHYNYRPSQMPRRTAARRLRQALAKPARRLLRNKPNVEGKAAVRKGMLDARDSAWGKTDALCIMVVVEREIPLRRANEAKGEVKGAKKGKPEKKRLSRPEPGGMKKGIFTAPLGGERTRDKLPGIIARRKERGGAKQGEYGTTLRGVQKN